MLNHVRAAYHVGAAKSHLNRASMHAAMANIHAIHFMHHRGKAVTHLAEADRLGSKHPLVETYRAHKQASAMQHSSTAPPEEAAHT